MARLSAEIEFGDSTDCDDFHSPTYDSYRTLCFASPPDMKKILVAMQNPGLPCAYGDR